MSIKLKQVDVSDYISIGSAKLDVKNGVYLVKGVNKDASEQSVGVSNCHKISNGAGKTTMFTAILQGLYNKNAKNQKGTVASANNLYTKRPYNISITFEKGNDEYTIINDRNNGQIKIIKNGDDISPKGINNQLTLIKNTIGFDFNTFASLTFLNQQSLNSIIDITNKDNIVYQFFDIDTLNGFEKSLKQKKKELNEQRTIIITKIDVLEKQKELLLPSQQENVEELEKELSKMESKLGYIESEMNTPRLISIRQSISALQSEISSLESELTYIKKDGKRLKSELKNLDGGICPTCGQNFSGNTDAKREEFEKLSNDYKQKVSVLEEKKDRLQKLTSTIESKVSKLESKKQEVSKAIRDLTVRLSIAVETERARQSITTATEEIDKEINTLKVELPSIDTNIKAVDALISILKSGAVVNEYLRKYRVLFSKNIKEIQSYTTFGISTSIKVHKGKMDYIFIDNGVEKSFDMLSAGEKTRVSLMLLIATLKTIEQLTGVSINYLVLDELLGVLDDEGIQFLKNIMDELRKTKSVYIITHHDEIEEDYADSIITVIKENNISRIEYE